MWSCSRAPSSESCSTAALILGRQAEELFRKDGQERESSELDVYRHGPAATRLRAPVGRLTSQRTSHFHSPPTQHAVADKKGTGSPFGRLRRSLQDAYVSGKIEALPREPPSALSPSPGSRESGGKPTAGGHPREKRRKNGVDSSKPSSALLGDRKLSGDGTKLTPVDGACQA